MLNLGYLKVVFAFILFPVSYKMCFKVHKKHAQVQNKLRLMHSSKVSLMEDNLDIIQIFTLNVSSSYVKIKLHTVIQPPSLLNY